MQTKSLSELSQPQRDRLAYIELRIRFIGELRRQDLVNRFGIQSAAASRDLALYKALAPGNIAYNNKQKAYVPGDDFAQLFEYPRERVMAWLTQGFGDGEPQTLSASVPSEISARLTHPDLTVLASVTRAIHRQCPLAIGYHSLSSGYCERVIVPFALFDNGLRWHVRAYDRKRQGFRDFVITRIQHPRLLAEEGAAPYEHCGQDIQWARIVELELVPHPDQSHPEITAMDYPA
ncbi:WYL domain-containing protein [Craterilacuibacter sp.]|uniref:WYL domain-containing protein n=1 Tax=Craterilacuibacter sp. TaxID=2870909 RepID=UPI003F3DD66F